MRPTLKEMLQGIGNIHSSLVMPHVMGSGDMGAIFEAGIALRLLYFLQEYSDPVLEAVWLENRDYQSLLGELGGEARQAIEKAEDPGLTERYRLLLETLSGLGKKKEAAAGHTRMEEIHRENAALKGAIQEVLLLIGEMSLKAGEESQRTALQTLKKRIRKTLRRTAARHDALADELLQLWRW